MKKEDCFPSTTAIHSFSHFSLHIAATVTFSKDVSYPVISVYNFPLASHCIQIKSVACGVLLLGPSSPRVQLTLLSFFPLKHTMFIFILGFCTCSSFCLESPCSNSSSLFSSQVISLEDSNGLPVTAYHIVFSVAIPFIYELFV